VLGSNSSWETDRKLHLSDEVLLMKSRKKIKFFISCYLLEYMEHLRYSKKYVVARLILCDSYSFEQQFSF